MKKNLFFNISNKKSNTVDLNINFQANLMNIVEPE